MSAVKYFSVDDAYTNLAEEAHGSRAPNNYHGEFTKSTISQHERPTMEAIYADYESKQGEGDYKVHSSGEGVFGRFDLGGRVSGFDSA